MNLFRPKLKVVTKCNYVLSTKGTKIYSHTYSLVYKKTLFFGWLATTAEFTSHFAAINWCRTHYPKSTIIVETKDETLY